MTVVIAFLGVWAAGVFWLGLVGFYGTPGRTGLGRELFRPVPLVNLLLWPLSLPAWGIKWLTRASRRTQVLFLLLWLALAYPLSGPALAYAQGRRWLPPAMWAAADRFYTPLLLLLAMSGFKPEWHWVNMECRAAGHRHANRHRGKTP